MIKRSGGKIGIGLVALAGRSRVFVEHRLFDLILGVSTSGSSVGTGENMAYERSPWLSVRRALRDLSPSPPDVFVDLGSGKGKVLLIAGRLPYRRVVGVEIDPKLSSTARRNVQQARNRLQAKEIRSVTANVLEWVIPGRQLCHLPVQSFYWPDFPRNDAPDLRLLRSQASHTVHCLPVSMGARLASFHRPGRCSGCPPRPVADTATMVDER